MRKLLIAVLMVFPLLLSGCGRTCGKGMTVVDSVDLQRYSGHWLELAKIPNHFQEDCVRNATADYRLLDSGQVEVMNRCITANGEEKRADGIARVVDPVSNAKLEVSFVRLFGVPLFWGDYWILALDEGYQTVVVGTPSRKYGWVLGRAPELSEVRWSEIEAVLQDNGYRVSDFIRSRLPE